MSNEAIEALRKVRDDAARKAQTQAAHAIYHEGEARVHRTQETQFRKIVSDCNAALSTLEAADRRIRLYGKEVVR